MKVTFLVTSYNYRRYVSNCIKSCLSQVGAKSDFEVVVVDDGSSDGTDKALSGITDQRLKVLTINNSGIERACNIGISAASGDYIVRVDADDILNSDYLANVECHFDKGEFIYTDYTEIDANGVAAQRIFLPEYSFDEIVARGDFLATGTCISKTTLACVGGYNAKIKNCGLESYELILRIIARGYRGYHIPMDLFAYRMHGSNMSVRRRDKIIAYGSLLMDSMGLPQYTTNAYHPYHLVLDS